MADTFAYPRIELVIGGKAIGPDSRKPFAIVNPATEEVLGEGPSATVDDLNAAVAAAVAAFADWRMRPALVRSNILRKFADLLRRDAERIAWNLTRDMGKTLDESRAEVTSAAEMTEWHAEECRRIYGRTIPGRNSAVHQVVAREPVGPCYAATPWNFPLSQAMRKIAIALAAGCTLVFKGPNETPSAIMEIANLLTEAGLPDGCLNLVWGDPAFISDVLIAHPGIRKISFTGSVPVGKHLAALAGTHMKRATMELGGHSPILVFDDADPVKTAKMLAAFKLRNAGQICISPTRFFVHDAVYDQFRDTLVTEFEKVRVGNGLEAGVTMGPVCHGGRVAALQKLVDNAAQSPEASVLTGGGRLYNKGFFFAPTLVETTSDQIDLMTQEPFGPVGMVTRFTGTAEVIARANSLPFGLASYVFTERMQTADFVADRLEAGMVGINHFALGLAETPLGGVKDSGYGSEGGTESFDAYLVNKFVTRLTA